MLCPTRTPCLLWLMVYLRPIRKDGGLRRRRLADAGADDAFHEDLADAAVCNAARAQAPLIASGLSSGAFSEAESAPLKAPMGVRA